MRHDFQRTAVAAARGEVGRFEVQMGGRKATQWRSEHGSCAKRFSAAC